MSGIKRWLGQDGVLSGRPARRGKRLELEPLEDRLVLSTFFVDASRGDDANRGTSRAPFATIQRAIEQADESVSRGDDSILVRSGTYVEKLSINDADGLKILGVGDVTIDGGGAAFVVKIRSGNDVVLRDLNVQNGVIGISHQVTAETPTGSLRVHRVNVHDNLEDGLEADFLEHVRITRSWFQNNGHEGICLDDVAAATLRGVTVSDNGDDGALIDRVPSVRVVGSRFHENGGHGIRFNAGATGTVAVRGVSAHGNRLEGLEVDAAESVSIQNGRFNNNKRGVEIDDIAGPISSVVLESVTAESNEEHGLCIDDTANLQINNSAFNNNKENGLSLSDIEMLELNRVEARGNLNNGADIHDVAVAKILRGVYNGNRNGIDARRLGAIHLDTVRAQENVEHGLKISGGTSATTVAMAENFEETDYLACEQPSLDCPDAGAYSNNGKDGIHIENAGDVTLSNVTGHKNGDDGLEVIMSGVVTTVDVLFTENADDDIRIV